MQEPQTSRQLKREIGFTDLILFYVVSGLSTRWIATAAGAGPSAIVIWLFACCGFFIPLAASVLELSSRYPQEGGLYVWTREAFGDLSGFIAGWTYWMSNLPYFPGVLYFAAASMLFAGRHMESLANNRTYYMAFAVFWLGFITLLNIRGLNIGKWINNLGAFGNFLPVVILIVLGGLSAWRFGSATHFTLASLKPRLSFDDALFWTSIFFALGGCEAGSFMGEEIKNPRRAIPRALVLGGFLLAGGYMAGTVSMLVALPASSISGVSGFVTAIAQMCQRLGCPWLVPVVAVLVAAGCVGGAAAFLSSTARLPFVAGIDRYLPPVFGRVHPRWHTPWVAIGVYGLAGMLFAFLGQAGTSVRGAYDVLISMSVINYFIPYAFLFLAMIRLQGRPAGPNVIRVPGGKWVAIPLAAIGFLTTSLTIVLSVFPSPNESNKLLAVFKVVGLTIILLAAGILLFITSKKRLHPPPHPSLDSAAGSE